MLLLWCQQSMQPFHPSDIINQYLLQEVPSATVAVTHDNQWTTLLNRVGPMSVPQPFNCRSVLFQRLLKPDELSHKDHVIAMVAKDSKVLTRDGRAFSKLCIHWLIHLRRGVLKYHGRWRWNYDSVDVFRTRRAPRPFPHVTPRSSHAAVGPRSQPCRG